VAAAASFVAREWSERCGIGFVACRPGFGEVGYAGHKPTSYVFLVVASDGSRFLVMADRWENTRAVAEDETIDQAHQAWAVEMAARAIFAL
jgi:hypothetical protein